MNKKEIELFKSLCSFKEKNFNEKLLTYASPEVLGHLFFNRMQAVAYATLEQHNLMDKVNREFRTSIKSAYTQNIEKNNSYFLCVRRVQKILSACNCNYALLKGAYLCGVYPKGIRTSNDIDLLIMPKDVTEVGMALLADGFRQGYVNNEKFKPATRKEIIAAKMLRGETVPYIKEVGLPGIKYLEVDINFSLDYKTGDVDVLKEMVDNAVFEKIGDFKVRTLRADDFFIHLCCHLYKEATTLPWIEMKRDMTLYKFCDIYMLLNDASNEYVDFLFTRAKNLGLEMVCAFAVIQTAELFNFKNLYAIEISQKELSCNPDFIHTVISPSEKKKFIFCDRNIQKRFFTDDRKDLLKEVK